MNLGRLLVGVCLALVMLGSGAQAALVGTGHLTMTNWYLSDGAIAVQSNIYTGFAGPFAWSFNGIAQDTPAYCMDLGHYFYWNQSFGVNVWTVPPDPYTDQGPFNTAHAAYVFQEYGSKEKLADYTGTEKKVSFRQACVNPARPASTLLSHGPRVRRMAHGPNPTRITCEFEAAARCS